jgi:SecD/SecF fusion protein
MSDRRRHGLVLLLVLGLLAASAVAIALKPTLLGLDLKGGVQLTYQAMPTPQTPKVDQAALNDTVSILESRVNQFGVSNATVQTEGGSLIVVSLPDVHNLTRAENQIGSTAQLEFYDWEKNAILPDGQSVASQLPLQNPKAVKISQGAAGVAPGDPGTGGMPLYQAVKLASQQQPQTTNTKQLSRLGNEYFLFGAPGSQACTTAAKDEGTLPVKGQWCYLAGLNGDTKLKQLKSESLPKGVSFSQGTVLTVPQGWVVLQASNPTPTDTIKPTSPQAQYFVLRDHPALSGKQISNPTASSQNGEPIVQFGFKNGGAQAFQQVTANIAHRGQQLQIGSNPFFQHFAAALDGQLLSVPQIDYKQYPDGIVNTGSSTAGASIQGSFTTKSAQDLATQLRLGTLPVKLNRISEENISASLGASALHKALIAGAVGLGIVVLFLILYYRLLGLIATSTLIIYGIYFYALIKLIPITMSLAGIAGMILTIGVAADANIVIFERVKEEIRAGRSIRSGIATGYKKGLSAIMDANVVTIMVAFILFVLSTQSVQGFAFTLGIGTIVSLFTAVLATQAIMTTAGDSRLMARPSALGAGKPKRKITFDFMGMSRYFFTASGVILLVGAFAIGGKGLNFGIDFTSGTTATTTLVKPVSAARVSTIAKNAGAPEPTVVKVGSSGERYKISFKKGSPRVATNVRDALNSKIGIARTNSNNLDWNATSIGPTFGKTVANEAIIAIIAALAVIALYVALRFDRKFTIPVLIALMHDILITAGVYALIGRQVTVDTVAALLTILGYSLYDTIIVFDRVRENIPRMPRAAFSQIVNRSMSEVITRSLATTFCTLLPVLALVVFGDETLRDFGFALLVGVASGAYSSIFIASPVLTHWKEREPQFRHRRNRIVEQFGFVPAYATGAADVEPEQRRRRTRATLSEVGGEEVSAAEFEELKRQIAEEELESGGTSTLTRRMARTSEDELQETSAAPRRGRGRIRDGGDGDGGGAPPRPSRRSQRLRAEAAEAQRSGPAPVEEPSRPALDPAITEDDLASHPPAEDIEVDDDVTSSVEDEATDADAVQRTDANGAPHGGEDGPTGGDGDGAPGHQEARGSDDRQRQRPKSQQQRRSRNRRHGRRR